MAPEKPHSPHSELHLVADVLGDSTRRGIFLRVCEASEPLTAADVAEDFGIHRTVARGHLEKLVEGGLLDAAHRRRPEGGRPPKVYSRSARRLDLSLPARQYELLAELLLESLDRFGQAGETIVREVGREYGRRLAALAPDSTPDGLLEPLRRAGAEITSTEEDGALELEVPNCLYRELSNRHPGLVCVLDRAMMEGLLRTGESGYRLSDATRRGSEQPSCQLSFVQEGSADARGIAAGAVTSDAVKTEAVMAETVTADTSSTHTPELEV